MNTPLISIIIATRNAAEVLPGLLTSLAEQSFQNFEIILQDGASSDETVAIAKNFTSVLSNLRISSETDSGIYDAWNRATRRMHGAWALFLGADDSLYSKNSLAQAAALLEQLPENIEYLATALLLTLQNGQPTETLTPAQNPYASLHAQMPVPHPALFYRSSLFAAHSFTTSLRIAGDYEFLCKTMRQDNVRCDSLILSTMKIGGVSGSLETLWKSELECLQVSRKYFPGTVPVKLLLRLARSYAYLGISRLFGKKYGCRFADFIRKVQGKPALWTRGAALPLEPLPEKPLYSLLVATIGSRDELARLLDSLTKQTYSRFEVLLADQNPPGFLDDTLSSFSHTLTIQHISIPDRGVSAARNALLPLAKGDILAFPDDDCWYAPSALERVTLYFSGNPEVSSILVNWNDGAKKDMPNTKVPSLSSLTSYSSFYQGGTITHFYRKAALKGIWYDEKLGPGTGLPYACGEDTDFLLQVMEKENIVKRSQEVLIHHALPDMHSPALLAKVHGYALGRMQLLRKHNFPLWFKLANVIYPLLRAPFEGRYTWAYRKGMFLGRVEGLLEPLRKKNIVEK